MPEYSPSSPPCPAANGTGAATTAPVMAEIRVGISGWLYPPWRGNFYPVGLPHRLELSYASRRFNALEVNGTFYSLKRPSVFRSWHDETPAGFVFALKGGRYITHMRKLRDPRQ